MLFILRQKLVPLWQCNVVAVVVLYMYEAAWCPSRDDCSVYISMVNAMNSGFMPADAA